MSADDTPVRPAGLRRFVSGGVAGNRRLSASTGVALHTFLWIQIASALFFALEAFNVVIPSGPWHAIIRPIHFFVGWMLLPLVLIKVASTSYRAARYYMHNPRYQRAGTPTLVARLTAPVMIISISVLFFTGIQMWSFVNAFGLPYIQLHVLSAIVFTCAMIVHVVIHVREAHAEAAADLAGVPVDEASYDEPSDPAEWRAGVLSRRVVLATGLGTGVALAASASQWPFPGLSWLAPQRAGASALDFPIMNYEGGGQTVDTALWRLSITGDDGLVGNPLSLSYDDLRRLPTEEHEYSIDCVTGWTAVRKWKGVPLSHLLGLAKASDSFGHILIRSTSGYHWSHHRSNVLLAGSLLVTHINGEQLNDDHGFPARLMIPGTVGQANVKWVDGIVVRSGAPDIYWAPNLVPKENQYVSGPSLPRDPAGKSR